MFGGEPVGTATIKREAFLKSEGEVKVGQKQQKLMVLTGAAWMIHQLVIEVVGVATQVVTDTSLMAEWEEWSGGEYEPPHHATPTCEQTEGGSKDLQVGPA